MNTKTIIISIFLAIAQFAFAQKEPLISYEKLEELSKTISELQMMKKGTKVDNGTADIVFKENNFKIFYDDKLASYSLNFTKHGRDHLVLIENIDFSKVIGLYEKQGVLNVVFPENHLTMQIYGDNENQTSNNKNVIEFYTNSDADSQKMFKAVYYLIVFMKFDKGIMTTSDGYRDLSEYKKLKPYDFYQKYPKSVLAYEGKLLEEDYERQVKFVNDFLERYKVPALETTSISQIAMKGVSNLEYHKDDKSYTLDLKDKIKQNGDFVSDIAFRYHATEGIKDVSYTILITKDHSQAKQKYDEILNDLSKNIDKEFIFNSSIRLRDSGKINKNLKTKDVSFINIGILTHLYKKENWYELYISFSR